MTFSCCSVNSPLSRYSSEANASDDCSTVILGWTPPSGALPHRRHPRCCTVTDGAGLQQSCAFTVQVTYPFTGFFQPVDNLPTLNQVKAGQAVPVKFSLGGNYGLGILASGSPTSQPVTCETGGVVDDIEQTVTAGSSSLTYDAGTRQHQYVWKTDKAWAGQCRQLTVTLQDGTAHQAISKFK